MKLSAEGYRLIKSFEGYHKRRKDGSCEAYKCPADVWTIGYGCTEGIKAGMVWTAAEAERALKREIAKFEAAVEAAVKVPLNQNEFDALVSFAYNCGATALQRSTLVKRLNAEKRDAAAREFLKWTRGGGQPLLLLSRRTREAALFRKPVEAPSEPIMPQKVDPLPGPVSRPALVGTAVCSTTAIAQFVPSVPDSVTQSVGNAELWTTIGSQIWALKNFANTQPLLALGLIGACAALWLWPRATA